MSTSSSEVSPSTVNAPAAGKRNGRPVVGDSKQLKMKNKNKSPKGLMKMFKRDKAKENGVVPVRPSCFNDDFVRRPESPDSPSKPATKAKAKEESRPYGLWRPKSKREWESDSGRTLTLKDTEMGKLSKVELLALQRVAINQLQSMNIPVSHALMGVSKKGRLSFNTFAKRRVSTDKSEHTSGIFGQPIDKVVMDQQPRSGSNTPGTSTPVLKVPSGGSAYQLPSSPTSSDYLEHEPNPTAALLEALSKTDKAAAPPSPKTQRQLALIPSEPRVPPIVRKAIELLDQKAVKTEGLFRISGSKARIDEIRRRFDKGQDVELSDANPHDVASVLKEFFRSLPEPLMTRELYPAFLATRKLMSAGQRRDALRLTCLLLPQASRDTLQELIEFLSRVALHSDGIILIDGTMESGNRMTEKNLGMIIGPNILHKERRAPSKGDYQVVKQDQEELANVCQVMEDLIRMHLSIFTIPSDLYDQAVKQLLVYDPEAVDTLLKRKCMDQGLFSSFDTYTRPRSSEPILRRTGGGGGGGVASAFNLVVPPRTATWRRSRDLSETEKTLDEAIRELDNLQKDIDDDLEVACDSAFSTTTSPTNSSEGVNASDITSLENDLNYIHHRNPSTLSEPDHRHLTASVLMSSSPVLSRKGAAKFSTPDTVSLPTFSPERDISPNPRDIVHQTALSQRKQATPTGRKHLNKRKLKTLPSITSTGTYSTRRSPVLKSKNTHSFPHGMLLEDKDNKDKDEPVTAFPVSPTPSSPTAGKDSPRNVEHSQSNGPQSEPTAEHTHLSDEGTII